MVGSHFARIYEPDRRGQPQGLGVDLLRRTLGESLRLELLPYQRAQYDVEIGEADVLVGPYRTAEREARFLFSQRAFYEDAMVFYARRNEASLWSWPVRGLGLTLDRGRQGLDLRLGL